MSNWEDYSGPNGSRAKREREFFSPRGVSFFRGSRIGSGSNLMQFRVPSGNSYNPSSLDVPVPSSFSSRLQLNSTLGPIFRQEESLFPPETLPPIATPRSRSQLRPQPRQTPTPTPSWDRSTSSQASHASQEEDHDNDHHHGRDLDLEEQAHELDQLDIDFDDMEYELDIYGLIPLEARRRIRQMGNEILDSFVIRLDRFFHGNLLDSVSDCAAVFTTKQRTGQRWLMVFKENLERTEVRFNRLLTHSLMVSIVSPTAVEIEAAKPPHAATGSGEMCILNFESQSESTRFYKLLQESQATTWNRREVSHEQRLKQIFSKINAALAQGDDDGFIPLPRMLGGSQGEEGQDQDQQGQQKTQGKRSPFTLPTTSSSASSLCGGYPPSRKAMADLDDNWRSSSGVSRLDEFEVKGQGQVRTVSKKPAGKRDGAGDGHGQDKKVMFHGHGTVYIKKGPDYSEIATGEVEVLDNCETGLNEIRFHGEKKEGLVLQQYVYKWNKAVKISELPVCFWDGAANLKGEEDKVPQRGHFKVRFVQAKDADCFLNAFMESAAKANDEGVRKRHVTYHLQRRKDALACGDGN